MPSNQPRSTEGEFYLVPSSIGAGAAMISYITAGIIFNNSSLPYPLEVFSYVGESLALMAVANFAFKKIFHESLDLGSLAIGWASMTTGYIATAGVKSVIKDTPLVAEGLCVGIVAAAFAFLGAKLNRRF